MLSFKDSARPPLIMKLSPESRHLNCSKQISTFLWKEIHVHNERLFQRMKECFLYVLSSSFYFQGAAFAVSPSQFKLTHISSDFWLSSRNTEGTYFVLSRFAVESWQPCTAGCTSNACARYRIALQSTEIHHINLHVWPSCWPWRRKPSKTMFCTLTK